MTEVSIDKRNESSEYLIRKQKADLMLMIEDASAKIQERVEDIGVLNHVRDIYLREYIRLESGEKNEK